MKNLIIGILILISTPFASMGKAVNLPKIAEEIESTNSTHSLRIQIKKMIKLLELNTLKASEELIHKYADPDFIARKIKKNGEIKTLITSFHKNNRQTLLKALKSTSTRDPKKQQESKAYTFSLPEGLGPHKHITFKWRDETKRFHIKN